MTENCWREIKLPFTCVSKQTPFFIAALVTLVRVCTRIYPDRATPIGTINAVPSESRVTPDHILLSRVRDFVSVASYDSQIYGGGLRPRLHTG
jgi:hypothetical protein